MICDSCLPASRLFHAEKRIKKNLWDQGNLIWSSWKIEEGKLDDVVTIRLPVLFCFFLFFLFEGLYRTK